MNSAINPNGPTGPFDFYEAVPVVPDAETRELHIQQIIDQGFTREDALKAFNYAESARILKSTEYQVAIKEATNGFNVPMTHLSIKRIDKQSIHDWRVLQQIKNAIVGDEFEAIELYPAESRLVDSANQYHLWVFDDPQMRIPVGFGDRLVDDDQTAGCTQRRFENREATWPSKAELASSLRTLSTWMREHTGPSDGAMHMLINAAALLSKIDTASLQNEEHPAPSVATSATHSYTFEVNLTAQVTMLAEDPESALQKICQRFDGHLSEVEATIDCDHDPILWEIDDVEVERTRMPIDVPPANAQSHSAETVPFKESWAERSFDSIDAGFFSADTFHSEEAVKRAEFFMDRWRRQISSLRKNNFFND
jgi:hypothetical protein